MRTIRVRYSIYCKLFLLGVLLYLITVLPFLIYHHGIFFYYGDYNVQQVPFYVLGNRIVKSGHLFWTPSIDLGTSWLGSFAMYLSGSPFFYLSVLFPESLVPYLMPFFMALKFGTALTTAYAYAQTLIPPQAKLAQPDAPGHAATTWNQGALIAALLYTFSGWSQNNIVFQHFHDAYAFFPLYLLVFDRFLRQTHTATKSTAAISTADAPADTTSTVTLTERKHNARLAGLAFSLMTAFTAILNYYFFYGEVLFLVLYYLVRYVARTHSVRRALQEIRALLLYGLLGVCLAAFYLIQVYDMVSGNTRLADTISGLDMIVYEGRSTPLAILKSLFYLPDLIGRGTLFTNEQIKNSAPGLYLPLFAASGVLAYCMAVRLRRDWLKRLLLLCAVIAFVPVLNSAFNMFNAEYYSRWYYMPLLFMAVATGRMLARNDIGHLRIGAWISIVLFVLIALCTFLPTRDENGELVWGQMVEYPQIYAVQLLITTIMMAALLLIVCIWPRVRASEDYAILSRRLIGIVTLACVVSTVSTLYTGNTIIARSGGVKWRQQMLDNTPVIPETRNANATRQTSNADTADDPSAESATDCWYRVETDGSSTNYELVWGTPTIHSFQSTVPGGMFDFYHGIGYDRTVNTKLSFKRVGARALTSVRYHLENVLVKTSNNYSDVGGMPGYTLVGESDGYNIYEQQHFIPMGFTFDRYITEAHYSLLESADDTAADRLLVRDLILSDEDAATYGYLFDEEDTAVLQEAASDAAFLADCDARARSACTYFAYTNSGFEAVSDNDSEELVFFSVPYDDGFTAYVDGNKVPIVRADYGLMAVDVPAGRHEITFTFRPAWLQAGYAVSAVAAMLIIFLYFSDNNGNSRLRRILRKLPYRKSAL